MLYHIFYITAGNIQQAFCNTQSTLYNNIKPAKLDSYSL